MKRNQKNYKIYKALIAKIWDERPHECVKCGRYLYEPKKHNFDHIKGRLGKLALDPDNIQILCFKCHFEKTHPGVKCLNSDWLDN